MDPNHDKLDGEESPIANTRVKTKMFKRRLKKSVVSDSDEDAPNKPKQKLMNAANQDSDSISDAKKTATASSTKHIVKPVDNDDDMVEEQEFRPRRIRKIKRNIESSQVVVPSDDDSSIAPRNQSDEEEFEPMQNKLKKMKNKILKGQGEGDHTKKEKKARRQKKEIDFDGNPKDSYNFDDASISQDSEEQVFKRKGEKKPKKEKEARKKRAPKSQLDNLGNSVNYVKTSNKLIGEIENNDLYASDEGILQDGFGNSGGANREAYNDGEDLRGANIEIDFGPSTKAAVPENKNKDGKFLQKMKSRKDQQEQSMEQSIVNLGFVQNLAKSVSANQLAANGIQLSVRQNLIKFIKDMDQEKITSNEQELLNVLKNSQQIEEQEDKQPAQIPNNEQIKKLEVEKVSSLVLSNDVNQDDEETGGLIFYDPKAEARSKFEVDFEEAQRNRQNLNKDNSIANSMVAQQFGRNTSLNQRHNLLAQLKNNRLKEISKNVNIESLQQCQKVTEFVDSKAKAKTSEQQVFDEDGESDDSEFNEEKALQEQKNANAAEMWDDEENFIGDQVDQVDQEDGDEEGEADNDDEISLSNKSQMKAVKSNSEVDMDQIDEGMLDANSQDADSDGSIIERRKKVKTSNTENQKSSATSQGSQVLKKRKKIKNRNLDKIAGFFEDEAELGSDDENNDDAKKAINKHDAEENEDGLDSDLDGFVDHGDVEEIGDPDFNAEAKFIQDLKEDDKQRTRIAMQSALFGQNRKRKRGQVEGMDDEDQDDYEKRKNERIQQREEELKGNSQNDEELEQHLLEGGKTRAIQHIQLQQMQEEDELSDDEIAKQMEHNKYYSFMRQKAKKDQIKEMQKRQADMEAELGNFMVDMNEEKDKQIKTQRQKTAADSTQSKTNSNKHLSSIGSKTSIGMSTMINQKKVVGIQNGIQDLKLASTQSVQIDGQKPKKKSYMPGGSMAAFFKQSTADRVSSHMSGQNIKATQKAQNNVPMIFKQRKNKA